MKTMFEVFGHEYPAEMFGTCDRCGGLGERDYDVGAYSICDEEPLECEVCHGTGQVFLEPRSDNTGKEEMSDDN